MMSKTFKPTLMAIAAVTALFAGQSVLTSPAEAKMSCANVSKRWQVCGEAKPWTKFVAGVGVRFQKPKPALAAK